MDLEIKFKGIDSWNRPIYKVIDKNVYLGSVCTLFDYSIDKSEIDNYFKDNLSELCIFGDTFDCEPLGTDIKKDINLIIV